jgi:hypothetical protein
MCAMTQAVAQVTGCGLPQRFAPSATSELEQRRTALRLMIVTAGGFGEL